MLCQRCQREKGDAEVCPHCGCRSTPETQVRPDGIMLGDYLARHGVIEPVKAIRILMPIMQALDKVHAVGMIHREICPDNMLILRNGTLKLTRPGAVRDGDPAPLRHGYAPEELYRSDGNKGPWTDVYGICATIYRMITGAAPESAVTRVRQDTLRLPSSYGIAISPALEKALMYGLEVYDENRCPDMGALISLFDLAIGGEAAAFAEAPVIELQDEDWESLPEEEKEDTTSSDDVPPKKRRFPFVFATVMTVLLVALATVFVFGEGVYTVFENVLHPVPKVPEDATMGIELMEEEEAPAVVEVMKIPESDPDATEPPAVQDEAFTRLLSAASLKTEELKGSQMIFVESSGTSAKVYCYEKAQDGRWEQKFGVLDGYVGAGGVAKDVGPEDDTTPTGTYRIESAFGTNYDPGTALSYTGIDYDLRWVTDPASKNYNRMVSQGEAEEDYKSCQLLYEYTKSYPYAVVFDYNRDPADPVKGCARFLHVATEPTYGGVGVAEDALAEILQWLDPAADPTISIF